MDYMTASLADLHVEADLLNGQAIAAERLALECCSNKRYRQYRDEAEAVRRERSVVLSYIESRKFVSSL